MTTVSNRDLGRELVARGLLPADCRLLEIVVGLDGGMVVRYEQYVSGERLAAFADAFRAVAEQTTAKA